MSAFVDTNILVYAADYGNPLPRKTRIARELLIQRGLSLSVQVLNEFIANARHPKKLNLSKEAEEEWIQHWLLFPIQQTDLTTFFEARRLHLRYAISHWDALIVAAAQAAGSATIYTEDLQHGQNFEGTRVVNPFRQ